MLIKDMSLENQKIMGEIFGIYPDNPLKESVKIENIKTYQTNSNRNKYEHMLCCAACDTYQVKAYQKSCINCGNTTFKTTKNLSKKKSELMVIQSFNEKEQAYDLTITVNPIAEYWHLTKNNKLTYKKDVFEAKTKPHCLRITPTTITAMNESFTNETKMVISTEVMEQIHYYMQENLPNHYILFLHPQGFYTKTNRFLSGKAYQSLYLELKKKVGLENIYNFFLAKDKDYRLNVGSWTHLIRDARLIRFSDFAIHPTTIPQLKRLEYSAIANMSYSGNTVPLQFEHFVETYEEYESLILKDTTFWNTIILGFEAFKESNKSLSINFNIYVKLAYLIQPKNIGKHNERIMNMFQNAEHFRKSFSIYLDYLEMSINYDLPYNKYPKYVETLHDIRSKEISLFVKNQANGEIDSKIQEIYQDKHFNKNSYEGYIIKSPNSLFDIIKEGENLSHCLAGYTQTILEGQTFVYFLRKEESPDTSYITIEIIDNVIVQAKGSLNRFLTKEELAILQTFAKVEGLTINLYK